MSVRLQDGHVHVLFFLGSPQEELWQNGHFPLDFLKNIRTLRDHTLVNMKMTIRRAFPILITLSCVFVAPIAPIIDRINPRWARIVTHQ